MRVFKLRENDEFIKLGQVLKATQAAENGGEAKEMILNGEIFVNGEVELRRGRKLYDGDLVSFEDQEIKIEK